MRLYPACAALLLPAFGAAAAPADLSIPKVDPSESILAEYVPEAAPDPQPPPYTILRYNERYDYLADPKNRTDWFDPAKYIPLDAGDPQSYLSFGGELRERYENLHHAGFGAGPAVTLPIFEGGALRGALRAERATYDASVDAYNAAVVGAVREVADQIVSLQSLDKQLQRTDEALKYARTAEDQAEQGFRAGLTDYLSVLNTQAELLVQQRNRAQLVAVQMQTYAALMKALGGGYEEPAGKEAGK